MKDKKSCELRTKCRLGGSIGDYIGFWGGPTTGYTTNLIQGSWASVNPTVACHRRRKLTNSPGTAKPLRTITRVCILRGIRTPTKG